EPESARASIFLTPGRDSVKVTQSSPLSANQPEQIPAKIEAEPVLKSSPPPEIGNTVASELAKPTEKPSLVAGEDRSRDVSNLQPTVVPEEEEEPVVVSAVAPAPDAKSEAVEQEQVKEATSASETTDPMQTVVEEAVQVTDSAASVAEKDEQVEDTSSTVQEKSFIPVLESAAGNVTVDKLPLDGTTTGEVTDTIMEN